MKLLVTIVVIILIGIATHVVGDDTAGDGKPTALSTNVLDIFAHPDVRKY